MYDVYYIDGNYSYYLQHFTDARKVTIIGLNYVLNEWSVLLQRYIESTRSLIYIRMCKVF